MSRIQQFISETHPPRLKQRRPSPLMTANGPQHGSSTRSNQAASNKRERALLILKICVFPWRFLFCSCRQRLIGVKPNRPPLACLRFPLRFEQSSSCCCCCRRVARRPQFITQVCNERLVGGGGTSKLRGREIVKHSSAGGVDSERPTN